MAWPAYHRPNGPCAEFRNGCACLAETSMRAVSLLVLVPIAAAGIAALIPHRPDILPPGRLVAMDGARLHIWCIGQGTPTIVLEPGLGGTSIWSAAADVTKSTRVCSYDHRPGRCRRTYHAMDETRHERCTSARAGRAWSVRVGRPFARRSYARLYRDQFRDDVGGLVLLDSVQSGQCERLPGAAAMIRDTTERLAICRRRHICIWRIYCCRFLRRRTNCPSRCSRQSKLF